MVSIELKYMNNKSRKGQYYYVKEKGKRGIYLKAVRQDGQILLRAEEAIQYYKQRHLQGKKVSYREKGKKQKTEKVIKGKNVKQQISKGTNTVTLSNVQKASKKRIKNITQKLLEKQIRNPEVRKKLSTHQQQKKYKELLTHEVTFYNKESKKLLTGKYFNKTTHEIVNKLQKRAVEGDYYNNEDTYQDRVTQKLKYTDMRAINGKQSGTISHYHIKITLRK